MTPGLPRGTGSSSSCSTSNTSYCNRIPDNVAQGVPSGSSFPSNIYFYLRGGTDGAQGSLCVAHSNGGLSNSATDCSVASGFSETKLWIRVALDVEPQGVIQRVGNQARFGLAAFNLNAANNGIQILTGVGLRQSIDLVGTTVETFNTNTAARSTPSRKVLLSPGRRWRRAFTRLPAIMRRSIPPSSRRVTPIPIAFNNAGSDGVGLAGSGVGSIGNNPSPGELKVLIGSESCPAPYNITAACGRDPYFMGAEQNFAWTKASIAAACCRSFVILLN